MEKYKLKFTTLQNEIFQLLCIKVGNQLNQSQIARFLNVSSTAVAKALPLLEKEGLINVRRNENMNLISITLDRNSKKAIEHKRVCNLSQIFRSGLAQYLGENLPGCLIILFGSYSLGEDTSESDIDIAIVDSSEKELELEKYERILERRINIQFYQDFKNINRHLRSNILNGITLSGVPEL